MDTVFSSPNFYSYCDASSARTPRQRIVNTAISSATGTNEHLFSCRRSRLSIWSRGTGWVVPSRVSLVILHTQTEIWCLLISRGGVHLFTYTTKRHRVGPEFIRPRNNHFPCSADHKQDWQPCPVDAYSAESADRTYIALLLIVEARSVNVKTHKQTHLHYSGGPDFIPHVIGQINFIPPFLELHKNPPAFRRIYLFAVHGLSERTTVQTSSIL